ncbi:MAG TPA: hypothetical protein ENI85_07475 [Deltaproteobacteria bacterium]|nr:hypothetical protein [Deltaproteobacteria bacterium]
MGRSIDCLVWVERVRAFRLLAILRELQSALEMTFLRICQADERADAARRLATRVSEQLRTPVGALTHAVDQLRGEAERVGLPSEWVERVSSESERVARVVEHLRDEMLAGSSTPLSTSN